jgi:N-(5-amino-5-carboxypentanoyl)-L-cysteinyl-D-valine synthase
LATTLKKTLTGIVAHCTGKKDTTYTPGDFTEDFEPYLKVNPDNLAGPVLFMLPPAIGGGESYLGNIIPRLKGRVIVAFNNYYAHLKQQLKQTEIEQINVEFLAAYYVSLIKKIQPSGEYHLFGWSFGGTLAFEISRQLTASGKQVASLKMVDTYFNCGHVSGLFNTNVLGSINMNYRPEMKDLQIAERMMLFKAVKIGEKLVGSGTEEMKNLISYYVARSDNHLKDIIKDSPVEIIHIDTDHDSWVFDNEIIDKVAGELHAGEGLS